MITTARTRPWPGPRLRPAPWPRPGAARRQRDPAGHRRRRSPSSAACSSTGGPTARTWRLCAGGDWASPDGHESWRGVDAGSGPAQLSRRRSRACTGARLVVPRGRSWRAAGPVMARRKSRTDTRSEDVRTLKPRARAGGRAPDGGRSRGQPRGSRGQVGGAGGQAGGGAGRAGPPIRGLAQFAGNCQCGTVNEATHPAASAVPESDNGPIGVITDCSGSRGVPRPYRVQAAHMTRH